MSSGEEQERSEQTRQLSIVEKCYIAFNDRDVSAVTSCFSDDFEYDDGQYVGKITTKAELQRHFQTGMQILPPDAKVVVDDIAVCSKTGNIGTRWHAEDKDGSLINLTRGVSFYTIDSDSGLIKTGFKVSEMVVKPSKQMSNGLVSSASNFMNTGSPSKSQNPSNTYEEESPNTDVSIIEKYFEAWNRKDMDAAIDCFCEDCVYETEDPVFVERFTGKSDLRNHLVKNADSLPSGSKIMLDDLAIDTLNGTFGVKWHLEVNEIAIPNLRGCSIYTLDKESGLLKSGFDVTEAPVKIPRFAQNALVFPSKLFFSFSS